MLKFLLLFPLLSFASSMWQDGIHFTTSYPEASCTKQGDVTFNSDFLITRTKDEELLRRVKAMKGNYVVVTSKHKASILTARVFNCPGRK